jgi:hypothetical protein
MDFQKNNSSINVTANKIHFFYAVQLTLKIPNIYLADSIILNLRIILSVFNNMI